MIVPLTKKKKKKTALNIPLVIHCQCYYVRNKIIIRMQLINWNSLTKISLYVRYFFFPYFWNGKTRSREREKESKSRIYISRRESDVDRNLGSASSPINNYDIVAAAKRFNQCHRANFRSPLASTSLLPLFLHHRLATPQEITIETQAEVAIYQFPGWTPRLNAGDRDSRFPRCGQRGKSIDSSQVSASSLAPFIRPGRLLFNRPVQRPRNRRLLETTPSFGRSIIYAVNNWRGITHDDFSIYTLREIAIFIAQR